MGLTRPYRALALPVLAILVPTAFIAVLASEWLSLEREAARLRSVGAAEAALELVRENFRHAVAESARAMRPRLQNSPYVSAEADPELPMLVAEAFLLTGGRLASGRSSGDDSTAARRAQALLASGAQALTDGRTADASRASLDLLDCCAAARDEFGVPYAIYAAWQHVSALERVRGAGSADAVVRRLHTMIDRGDLAEASDLVSLRLLAERLAGRPGVADLVARAEDRAAAAAREHATARLVESWADSLDWLTAPAEAPVLFGPWSNGPSATTVAAWRSAPSERVVLVIAPRALAKWVSEASGNESSFILTLADATGGATQPDVALTAPLFAETPALTIAVRRGRNDPATDQRRERLFMTAVAGGLALTLIVGCLAARDVFRELRTASLRSTFLAGVTHEIKTPLTSIRLLTETLKAGRASPDVSTELLSTIAGETEHLTNLVDNVLGTARVESGTRVYQPKCISVPDIVHAARLRFDYTLTKEGFSLVESMPGGPLWAEVDPDALAQAVLNLLSNATKYSGASREIHLRVHGTDREASVEVSDRGVGVPAREQAHIFRRFYRARGTSRETTGTGLGLTLVQHFAEAHGGRVTVSSEPGRGSAFTIVLPRAATPRREGTTHG